MELNEPSSLSKPVTSRSVKKYRPLCDECQCVLSSPFEEGVWGNWHTSIAPYESRCYLCAHLWTHMHPDWNRHSREHSDQSSNNSESHGDSCVMENDVDSRASSNEIDLPVGPGDNEQAHDINEREDVESEPDEKERSVVFPSERQISVTFAVTRRTIWGVIDIQFQFETKYVSFKEGMLLVPIEQSDDSGYSSHRAVKVDPELSGSTVSEQTWLQWLEACNPRDHPECHQNRLLGECITYPSRLVDVSTPGIVKVVDTSSMLRAKYNTLSHCWGGANFLTLQKEISEELFQGVSVYALPKTFSDAVEVTRRMGILYIWIDSLCIFQDSEDDWVHESALMAGVYLGAYCNLAATSSRDSHGGLFFNRDPSALEPAQIRSSWFIENDQDSTLLGDCFLCTQDYWRQMAADAPLLKRAWVVQERILSTRTIHFSQPQLFWECLHTMACEIFPIRFPVETDSAYMYQARPDRLMHSMSGERIAQVGLWRKIVEVYTWCDLTFSRDKLPAMAGLASLFANSGSLGQYLWGLWEKEFFLDLAWSSNGIRADSFPLEYRAPTWSWASTDNPVRYNFELPDTGMTKAPETCRLIDTGNLSSRDEASRKRPAQGFARVETALYIIVIKKEAPRYNYTLVVQSDRDTELDFTGASIERWYEDEDQAPKQLYLMPCVAEGREQPLYLDRHLFFYGVVLEPTGARRGEFKRVGSFRIDHKDATKGSKPGDLEILDGHDGVPGECYEVKRTEEIDGRVNHLYTFTIV